MRRLFLAVFFICIPGLVGSLGCTLFKKSVIKFDPTEFIFLGTVVGYTGPVAFDGSKANGAVSPISATFVKRSEKPKFVTYGIIVKATEVVHLPAKSELFEIFEYSLGADCLVQGISDAELRDRFPLNAEVRVISKKVDLIQAGSGVGPIRLENRLAEDGSIALNSDRKGNRMTSADSIFDYKTYSYDMNRDSYDWYLLPIFEIRKELFRLSRTNDQGSRNKILDRIYHAPIAHDIEHGGIFKTYTSSEAEYRRYFESHLRATDPDFYVQYKAFQDAFDKLVEVGYSKDDAEAALKKALEKGTDIDAAKLYEASLKYLPARKHK